MAKQGYINHAAAHEPSDGHHRDANAKHGKSGKNIGECGLGAAVEELHAQHPHGHHERGPHHGHAHAGAHIRHEPMHGMHSKKSHRGSK